MPNSQEPGGVWNKIRNTSVAGYSLTRPILVITCLILWCTPLSDQDMPSWLSLLCTGQPSPAPSSTLWYQLQDSLVPQARNSPFWPVPWSDIFPDVPGKSLSITVWLQYNLTGGYDFLVVHSPSL